MKKELTSDLIGTAGALLVIAAKPDAVSAITAGVQLAKLGTEVRSLLDQGPLTGRRALQRIQRKVLEDYQKWASSEGLKISAEISIAEAALAQTLPNLLLDVRPFARAALQEGGFEAVASQRLIEAVSQANPLFAASGNPVVRDYAQTLIASVVRAVASEKQAFAAITPPLLLEMGETIGGIDRKVDRILAALEAAGEAGGLSPPQVDSLLRAFNAEHVPDEDVLALLLQKADELKDLQRRIDEQAAHDSSLKDKLDKVSRKVRAGKFEGADADLQGLIEESGATAARSLQAVVELIAMRATLAKAQLQPFRAAEFFDRAASIASAFDERQAFYLLSLEAETLLDHAVASPGDASYRRALHVIERMLQLTPPGSQIRTLSAARLVSTLGLYAERAGPEQAHELTEAANAIGEQLLSATRPAKDPDLWFGVANDMGAAMNLATRRALPSDQLPLAKKAAKHLRRAVFIAREHGLEDLPNGLQNLATALRNLATCSPRKKPLLEEAARCRREAISLIGDSDTRSLSNAYDSLGNDLKALGRLEPKRGHAYWRQAIGAYRQALRLRRKFYKIDWARTQFNLAGLYMSVRLAPGADLARLYRAADRHFSLAFSRVTPETSPGDYLMFIAAAVNADLSNLVESGTSSPTDVRRTSERAISWAQTAHRTGGVDDLLEALLAAMTLVGYFFDSDSDEHKGIVSSISKLLDELLPIYRFTPLGLHIELWRAQAGFVAAAMGADTAGASAARRQVAEYALTLRDRAPAELLEELDELLGEMDERMLTISR